MTPEKLEFHNAHKGIWKILGRFFFHMNESYTIAENEYIENDCIIE